MRRLSIALIAGVLSVMVPGLLVAQDSLIPDRRFAISRDADLPGGDIATIFDTTQDACERACLTNPRCTAFTFNTRNGSCFPKADPGAEAFYQGAISGRVLTAAPGDADRARLRASDLGFLGQGDLRQAHDLARDLGKLHATGVWSAEDLLKGAAEAEAQGNAARAMALTGAAVNLADAPDLWGEYARRLLLLADRDQQNRRAYNERAATAAINGYLRADNPALRHTLLVHLGDAMERIGRGRDTVGALRLAQSLQPRDDTAAALEDAIGKYGFRIVQHDVQSDSARPRLCAQFSEDLATSGVDYAPFVQLPAPDLAVEVDGTRQLCIVGLAHGQRPAVTFREGLPAADGQTLAKSVQITAYVRDRSPAVRFPGRGYVLPRTGSASVPVETVNVTRLELELYRVSDRNLMRSLQEEYFGYPMAEWQEGGFRSQVGERLWQGVAEVPQEVNRDTTTRLPMDEALAGLSAGIYALRAAIPGADPYQTPAAWQWFVVSDLGMTAMSGNDGLHVFVRALGTAEAKAGITVELVNRANAVLGTVTTDDQGYARFDAGLTRGTGGAAPGMIIAREGEADVAFLSLTEPEFDLSDRGVEGREAAPPVDVFLTTERGAYRAGETVYVTALARDGQGQAIKGLPLTWIVKRPDGVEYARAAVNDWNGGYVYSHLIAGSAPRGVWKTELYADLDARPLASRTFLVEDFLPERIDFDLTLPDTPLRPGDAALLTVEARYLFGAPGADLSVEGEVILRAAQELPGFPGYVFGRHDNPLSPQYQSLEGGARTDAEGRATLSAALPDVAQPDRPLEAAVRVRVAEGSGRPVEREVTRALAPATAMIGIRPMFDGVVPEGAEARFSVIGIGPDAAPLPMKVKWRLTRIETDYQWYSSYGNWNWEPVTTRTPVSEGEADLGATPLEIAAPVTWGEYELAVERVGGGVAESSTTFYAGWYGVADASSTPDTLEVSLDKPAYAPGDTARLRVVPRAAGVALVTVLSDRLIDMRTVEVAEGENLIGLPVTADWGTGVYVTASVLRPMDVAAGRNPARALGLAHAAIDPGARQLRAAVEAPAEAAPRGPLEVAVRVDGVAAGETAHVTVAAVDVGILNLTRFASPDPSAHYFGQRKLGMGLRDVYGRLIDGLNGAAGVVRSGGDAGAQARLQSDPPTEELVAYFSGPIEVGADGLARASFDLPAFNGTVRVMAVAWSDTGVGQAEADVLVRDPVVVTASVPRFMAPGDESRMLLEIVHATGPTGRMGLDVTANGLSLGAVPSGFDLGEKAKATFAVPLMAGAAGDATVRVALTTPDGRQLVKDLVVPVRRNDPEVMRVSRFDLAPGQEFTLDQAVFDGLVAGSGKATMAVGPLARLNAPGLLAALDRYPYGCTEQMTSRALPLLYFGEVAQVMGLQGADDIDGRIREAITEILQNQTAEGAFGLWGPSSGDMWLDAFVTDFLSRARARGFDVPDRAFRQALDNLRNQVNYTADFDEGGESLAYALMVLAREGAAAVGDLRYYADVKGDAFATPLAQAQLGAALASYGDPARADAMFRRAAGRLQAEAGPEREQIFRADFGTRWRDAAAVLALAVESGSQAVDRESLTDRIAAQGGQLSTQEATWALMAANALIDRPGADGITIDGAPATGPLVRVLDAGGAAQSVVNGSAAATTITLTTYGVPEVPEAAGGTAYAITRSHYTMDGQPASLDGVKVGTRLVAVVEIVPFGRGEARLIVADPLPAGFEIDNPNLLRGGDTSALEWLSTEENVTHAEFRQDRFLAALDRFGNEPFRLAYVIRAVSPGTFHHPAATVEDMYRPDHRGRSEAGRVTIAE
ncbi:alpha-2-macroglobulin family protein [Aliigemmobacter aestuarii]|uniref:Alpha-2-macroglobulin family protein n=1 Tax=Aliigemmobacter aestuarii TaxID=1445661 RepID=A0A4S3MUX2_9RHOB|nr:alpha-2-macroglobulin family protein [Gemmobacter aestuarii]THD85745.1 alpha-2-macroglobulin family protein [Gemmobacter aestuarii]